MGWYDEVRDGTYEALCASFGLDPDSQTTMARFVPAYVENTMTPQAPRNVDVTYFAIEGYQGESGFDYIMLSQKNANGQAKTSIKKTVPSSVLITFYGPNADNDAETFWSMFQWDNGVNSPRAILRKRNIVPIGKPARPISLYEVEGTYQRRRCDVRLGLAYYDVSDHDSSHVDTVPEIGIRSQT